MSIFDKDKTWWRVAFAPPYGDGHVGERETLGQAMLLAWESGRRLAEPKEMWLWETEGGSGSSRSTAKVSAVITPNNGITFSEIR